MSSTAAVDYIMNNAPIFFAVSAVTCFIAAFIYGYLERRPAKPFLDKSVQQIRLVDKVALTHNAVRLRFELPSRQFYLGLPTGGHIRIYGPNKIGVKEGNWNGAMDREAAREQIERNYTPISGNEFKGFVDFVVKVYKAGADELFVDGGKMSQYLGLLEVGDVIDVKGPFGLITYDGQGQVSYGKRVYKTKRIGMIAGGSGITPMMQILRHILNDRSDQTELWLLFANLSEEDVLLQDMLEEMAAHYSERFHLWFTIDKLVNPNIKWRYSVGVIDEEMMRKHLPVADDNDDALILMCGRPSMINEVCKPNLAKIGWKEENVLKF